MGRPIRDLTNSRFGALTAIKLDPNYQPGGGAMWLCRCVCIDEATGVQRVVSVRSNSLLRGLTKTCGRHTLRSVQHLLPKSIADTAREQEEQRMRVSAEVARKDRLALEITPQVHGRLYITDENTTTHRDGTPLGPRISASPFMGVPDVYEERWGRVALCSCGRPVILTLDELESGIRRDCAWYGKNRAHKEPKGSPAWDALCSDEERAREAKWRTEKATDALKEEFRQMRLRPFKGMTEGVFNAEKLFKRIVSERTRREKKREYNAKRDRRKKVELPAPLAAGEQSIADIVKRGDPT